MGDLRKIVPPKNPDSVQRLVSEITGLEAEISSIQTEIQTFENTIRVKLNLLISRLIVLNQKMKEKQQSKKEKRLEQKRRGKNYKEPVQSITTKTINQTGKPTNQEEAKELKRLYKEAVVYVHPDKIGTNQEEEAIKTATDLTAQLNGIYKNGDLEALLDFYQNIILANPSSENKLVEMPTVNPKIRMEALLSKKGALIKKLQDLEANYLYHVLKSYEDPHTFIDELELQFQEKIGKLEKRTRKF
jgi:hypothetical protein